jgi:hypothetical protein
MLAVLLRNLLSSFLCSCAPSVIRLKYSSYSSLVGSHLLGTLHSLHFCPSPSLAAWGMLGASVLCLLQKYIGLQS